MFIIIIITGQSVLCKEGILGYRLLSHLQYKFHEKYEKDDISIVQLDPLFRIHLDKWHIHSLHLASQRVCLHRESPLTWTEC